MRKLLDIVFFFFFFFPLFTLDSTRISKKMLVYIMNPALVVVHLNGLRRHIIGNNFVIYKIEKIHLPIIIR